jgi:2-phospho-L-lactate/phosphoenolpyruvate guanylyltransferase
MVAAYAVDARPVCWRVCWASPVGESSGGPSDRIGRAARSLGVVETAALIPIKGFHAAKARLASVLSDSDRERLARWMATRVIEALRPMPTFVACDDDRVAEWADALGVGVLWGPGLGLNGAIDVGVETLAGKGAEHVLIAHGDIPRPENLPTVPTPRTIVLVPDRRCDGTNVLSRPTAISMAAEYGAASFDRHLAAALASGIAVQVRSDPFLSIDVDTVDDCRHPIAAAVLRPFLGEAMPR